MQPRVTYLDSWNTLEQACLASAVRVFGDCETNWSIICNHLKTKFSSIERPENWLTPESCEAQYKWLSDKYVKMEISCERPVNQILQNLKQIGECESQPVTEQEKKYKDLKERLELFASNEIESGIIMEYYEEACKKNREREEILKKLGLKTDSPNRTKSPRTDNKTDGCSPLTTSPLLSSLLKNPPAVQYRPTLSTASFIPSKSTQGTSRTSSERRAHSSDTNFNLGSQSSPLNEQSSLLGNSTASPARKLDFQDPSTSSSVSSQEQHSVIPKEGIRDVRSNNEPVSKSNIHNLENIPLIPPTEEYLSEADMLLQVIDNLEGKQLLDKVLDELAGDQEATIDKTPRDAANIPIVCSFVTDSPSSKVTAISVTPQSKSAPILDSPLVNTKFEDTNNQYTPANDITIIEEEVTSKLVSDDVEQQEIVETVTVNADSSSFSSLAVSVTSESISDLKSDSESVEYVVPNAVKKTNENGLIEDNILVESDLHSKSIIVTDDISEEKEELRMTVEARERVYGATEDTETQDTSVTDQPYPVKKQTVETSFKVEEIICPVVETEIEKEKRIIEEIKTEEVEVVCEIPPKTHLRDSSNTGEPHVSEFEPVGERKEPDAVVDHDIDMKSGARPERSDKTEEVFETHDSTSISPQPTAEVANSSSQGLPIMIEKSNPTPIEEELSDVKLEATQKKEDVRIKIAPNKNKRQLQRKRKSTIPESSGPSKIPRMIEVVESPDTEEPESRTSAVVKEMNVTVKDNQAESLDSEPAEGLFKAKEEPAEDIVPQFAQTENEKLANKVVEVRKAKPKVISSRRSSIRSQNQNSSALKTEEVLTPPSTPSSSKTNDAAISRKKSLVLAHSRLAAHKYSSAFSRPISNKTVVGYEDVIYNPLDLQTIKRKVDNKVIATVTDFQRDVLFMILNAKMFNRINSQVYNMAVEIQKEALRDIQLTVRTLNEGVLFEMEDDVSEKVRKRQSVENVKKDQKQSKRSKLLTKDENISLKKIKVEENESVT